MRVLTAPCRMVVIDDHPAVRAGLASWLRSEPDLQLCGEAATAAEGERLIAELSPNMAIIDLTLKESNGLQLIQSLRAAHKQLRILVWSMHSESEYAEQALRAGANGFINKQASTVQLLEAIRSVAQGRHWLSPNQTQFLLQRVLAGGKPSQSQSPITVLSARELEVFRLYGEGLKTSSIARRLHISAKTVGSHQSHILSKLNLADSNQLIHFASRWLLQQQIPPPVDGDNDRVAEPARDAGG